jgi:cytochrome P450
MRLYPPAWIIGRQAIEEVPVGGTTFPKGAGVLMCQWVMHRHPRYFPDPEAFNPDRWEKEAVQHNPPFAYFPFGGGPRLCIGKPFAIQEAVVVLAMVAQHYRLTLVPGQTIVPQPSITLRPRPGVKVILEERSPVTGGNGTGKAGSGSKVRGL